MEFCPTCGNMLLYELPKSGKTGRFSCPTCAYVCQNTVEIEKHVRLVKKAIVPILTEADFRFSQQTDQVNCTNCGHTPVGFLQVQTRSADEPMTEFYKCAHCNHTWKEG